MPVSSPDFLSNISRSDLHHEPVALRFVRIHLRREHRPARRGHRCGNAVGAGPGRLDLSGLLCAQIGFHLGRRLKPGSGSTRRDMQTPRCASLETLRPLVARRRGTSRDSGASSLATKSRALVGRHHGGFRGCMGAPGIARRPDMARSLVGGSAAPASEPRSAEHATRRLSSLREKDSVSAAHRTPAGMRALRTGFQQPVPDKAVKSLRIERGVERRSLNRGGRLDFGTAVCEASVERGGEGSAVENRTPVLFWRLLEIHNLTADAALGDRRHTAPSEESGTKAFGVIVDPDAEVRGQRGIVRSCCLAIRVTIGVCRSEAALIGGIAKDFDCSHFLTPVMLLPEPLSKRCANKIS